MQVASNKHPAWRVPLDVVAMAFGLSIWVVCGLVLTVFCAIVHRILPRERGKCLGQRMLSGVFRFFIGYLRFTDLLRLDAKSLRVLRDGTAPPGILAPNHLALWDAVFLIAACPNPACVMKNPILRNPLLGGGARLAGFIPNEPLSRMLRDAVQAVRSGDTLILFPEGTRTRSDQALINPLKGGCAIIACQAGASVCPVFIRNSSRFLEKGWPPWRKPAFPVHVAIDLGEPMKPRENESPQEFTARLQAVFETELATPHPLKRVPMDDREHAESTAP